MNKKKRLLCFFLCFILVVQITTIEVKAETIQPRYTYISAFGATLTANSSKTTLTVAADLFASVLAPVSLKCYVQYLDNGYWRSLKMWSESGTKKVSLDATCNVDPDGVYRLLVCAYVYDSNGTVIESDTMYQYLS